MTNPRRVEKVKLECDRCGGFFETYASKIASEKAKGREGPKFCSASCFDATRPGPICTKCGGPNLRGARKRICEGCIPVSPSAAARKRADERRSLCPEGLRWCTICDEFLPPNQFHSDDHACASCVARRNNAAHLQRSYGIDLETYDRLLAAQGGCCAICGSVPKVRRFHVDHDHKTGVIRGVLCLWCNHRLLGGARESVDVLQSAINYLTTPPALAVIGEVVAPKKAAKR